MATALLVGCSHSESVAPNATEQHTLAPTTPNLATEASYLEAPQLANMAINASLDIPPTRLIDLTTGKFGHPDLRRASTTQARVRSILQSQNQAGQSR